MLSVTRGELLDSKVALEALGKVYMPVGKELYWFVKKLSKLQKALKREGQFSQKKNNEYVQEFGTEQTNGRKGIQQTDVEAMEKYSAAMNEIMLEMVSIDITPLKLSQLAETQATLQANDQVALMWLFEEDEVVQ